MASAQAMTIAVAGSAPAGGGMCVCGQGGSNPGPRQRSLHQGLVNEASFSARPMRAATSAYSMAEAPSSSFRKALMWETMLMGAPVWPFGRFNHGGVTNDATCQQNLTQSDGYAAHETTPDQGRGNPALT